VRNGGFWALERFDERRQLLGARRPALMEAQFFVGFAIGNAPVVVVLVAMLAPFVCTLSGY
jgi:hypothetical protein